MRASSRRCSAARTRASAGAASSPGRRRANSSCSSSGRRARCLARPTRARRPRGSRGWTVLGSSQTRAAARPRSRRARRRSRVSSTDAKFCVSGIPRRYAAKRGSPSTASIARLHSATLPSPPHCASMRPPGRRAANRRWNSRSWSRIQWKMAFEKMRVDGLVEIELEQVGHEELDAVAERRRAARAPPRPSTARRRRRSRGPPARRSRISFVTRPLPQPASSTVSSPPARGARAPRAAHSSCGSATRS